MKKEKTIFEELKERVARMVYNKLDEIVSNIDDIKVVKCMKPYPNHPDTSDKLFSNPGRLHPGRIAPKAPGGGC